MGPKGDRAKSKRLGRSLKFLKKSCYSKFIHTRKLPMKARVPSGLGTCASMALWRACPGIPTTQELRCAWAAKMPNFRTHCEANLCGAEIRCALPWGKGKKQQRSRDMRAVMQNTMCF